MVNDGLQIKEQACHGASRMFDFFLTGLSSVLFLTTAPTFKAGAEVEGFFGVRGFTVDAWHTLGGLHHNQFLLRRVDG